MKNTKIMLGVVITYIITYLLLVIFTYCISDLSFKQCMIVEPIGYIMFIVGWVPAIFVGIDLERHYRGY